MAILPWNFQGVDNRWNGNLTPTVGHEWLAEFLLKERDFLLTHSTYPCRGQGSGKVGKISLSSEERGGLWTSSLFSRPKPDPKVAAAIGRRLGVDLVFMVQAEGGGSVYKRPKINTYLVETETGRIFTASREVSSKRYGELLVQHTQEQLRQYLAEADQ